MPHRPFYCLSAGKTAETAFQAARKDARRVYGTGRTGTVADKVDWAMGPPIPEGIDAIAFVDLVLERLETEPSHIPAADTGVAICWDLGEVPDGTGRHAFVFAGFSPVSLYETSRRSIEADPEWAAVLGRTGKALPKPKPKTKALPAKRRPELAARSTI